MTKNKSELNDVRRFILSLSLMLALVFTITIAGRTAMAGIIYQSDFQGGDTTFWSTSSLSTDNNGKRVMGLFNNNETVTLTLPGQAPGDYTVDFDFYALFSWDGDGTPPGCCGPDKFRFSINGTTYLNATFTAGTAAPSPQSYSDATPLGGGPFPGGTDNTGLDILSYNFSSGAVPNARYTPAFNFTHPGGNMTFTFRGLVSQPGQIYLGFPDEPWALDNITVASSAVPEPCTLLLLGGGLAGVYLRRRRQQL